LYAEYALHLIRNYPTQFFNAFLIPNAIKFAVPPPEFLGIYNMGSDSVGVLAKEWFNYKSQMVKKNNSREAAKVATTRFFPILAAVVNAFLLICLAGMVVFNGFRQPGINLNKVLILVLLLWSLNTAFSVFASPVVLRYQIFGMLISFALAALTAENIYRLGMQQDEHAKKQLI
jgi:hypothetical protein